jgi:hypothetical protein
VQGSVTSKNIYYIYKNLVTECFGQNRQLSGNTEFQKKKKKNKCCFRFFESK